MGYMHYTFEAAYRIPPLIIGAGRPAPVNVLTLLLRAGMRLRPDGRLTW